MYKCIPTHDIDFTRPTEYKGMRERDAQGSARSAWRITVRQLESLIRLSEACARLHCCDVVEAKHVKEASRLLRKSIIRVEIPDINLGNPAAGAGNATQEGVAKDAEMGENESQSAQGYESTIFIDCIIQSLDSWHWIVISQIV